ncbi:TIGR03985 family CRISPR-associated protein [Synechocystis sp. LKSZ1]|uniref:TIGR03985 family CRISPR-associated protein n=1 Tax=Synechocystis sp. LKSZ1 TaxID=3144951 RepID=UPI00336BAFA9
MSDTWPISPTIEILDKLARYGLKQNLPKAFRLWIILDYLYGDHHLDLEALFSFNQWLEQFFPGFEQVHKTDAIHRIKNHHPHCRCQRSIQDWLDDYFQPEALSQWKQHFLQRYPGFTPEQLDNLLNHKPLFAVSRKSLWNDFERLCDQGYLRNSTAHRNNRNERYYQKINPPPFIDPPAEVGVSALGNLVINDLADFLQDFGEKIRGEQRFFLDLEYIIHHRLSPHIEQLRQSLKVAWSQDLIPPITLEYFSASNFEDHESSAKYYTYPVCLYYSQRVPYLFAFGQNPQPGRWNWYDFRLDRIKALTPITWQSPDLRQALTVFTHPGQPLNELEKQLYLLTEPDKRAQKYQAYCSELTPDIIHSLKAEAWGFDFFRPKQTMLLRFNQYFHARYILGTERDELFRRLSVEEVERILRRESLIDPRYQRLLSKLSTNSVYCRVDYREGDYNVIMRLRAWGANVEVLFPMSLRQEMQQESQKIAALYS